MRSASAQEPRLSQPSLEPRATAGIGVRAQHYPEILQRGVRADLAEATSENFLGRGGRALSVLERVRADMPVALHGVSLSIGGTDPLDEKYITELRELAQRIDAMSVSDHLCFGTFGGHYGHDLWPLPFTEEALQHVAQRVERVQARLGRQLLLENVASYVEFRANELTEWEFLDALAARSGAGILLDVNNVFVSAYNHGFSADAYLAGLAPGRVRQMHLAGHHDAGAYLLDDHGSRVPEAVWQLFDRALARFGAIPTIVEWDERVPALAELEREADRARAAASRTLVARESRS